MTDRKQAQIKFRAWHPTLGYSKPFESGSSPKWSKEASWDLVIPHSTCTVEQFTGLFDIHGVEIYEADIVLHNSVVKIVIWESDTAMFECVTSIGSRALYSCHSEGIEVIGNIFENLYTT